MDRIIKKKKWTVKKILWLTIGGIIAILIIYNIFWGDRSSKLNVRTERITIEEIKEDFFQDYITITGTVFPIRTVFLDAIEGGRVEEIYIEAGSMVEEGDVILKLSNTNLHLSIMNREASLAEQMNNLRNTRLFMEQNKLDLKRQLLELDYSLSIQEREYENKKDLYEKNFISDKEFTDIKDRYEYLMDSRELVIENQKQDSLFRAVQIKQLEESVERMEENLTLVRKKLDDLNVKALVSGELAFVNAEIGEAKSAGERLGQINVLDSYKIQANIDEHYISRVNVNLPGEFVFTNETYELKATKIYPEVQNGRFSVDLEFIDNFPQNIRIGQTFRVKLELGQSKVALLVPRGGFFQSTGGQWIYVLDKSESFAEKRDIRLGSMNPRYIEVLEGLEAGEKVVISSYDNFGDVDKLILKD
ncbi:MAG: HlyD family efflux transporter periplasmic adaptor subunit [Armatimonadetes bacterium]|nr:HlyD family efflux transporter periplasmic adaptor subunit [Armatimonadota bacterium]